MLGVSVAIVSGNPSELKEEILRMRKHPEHFKTPPKKLRLRSPKFARCFVVPQLP